MIYSIQNQSLSVRISRQGAELQSILLDGREYLWQGDPVVWGDRSPVLFPIVGRIKNGSVYQYQGKAYQIHSPHGFAAGSLFAAEQTASDRCCFRLTDSEQTRASYPFRFCFDVTYQVQDNTLLMSYRVKNRGDEPMYFSCGAHPGFRVPCDETTAFEDWFLEFDSREVPERILLSGPFLSGRTEPYHLQKGRIHLRHSLFDSDAVILQGLKHRTVAIASDKSPHRITAECGDFAYLGFWHAVGDSSRYVCIEPWDGLPSHWEGEENLETKPAIRCLAPGEEKVYHITFCFE